MLRAFRLPFLPHVFAVIVAALLVAGCQPRLAWKHEFFLPMSGPGGQVTAETERVLRNLQLLQTARRACLTTESGAALPETVSPGKLVCAPQGRTRAAYGSRANAYQRWVEDGVRQLPSSSQSASSISSGG